MISLYTGAPGSGKTIHSMKDARFTIENGGCLIINFPLYLDKVKIKIHPETEIYILEKEELEYSPNKVINAINAYISRHGVRYVCVIIDEAQDYFDSREWNKRGRKDWLGFFSKHRHIGRDHIDIILITQVDLYLDKRLIKGLIEYKYLHRNILYCGALGAVLGLLMPALCMYIPIWMPAKKQEHWHLIYGKKKLRNMYNTNAYAAEVIPGDEKKVEK